MTGTAPNSPFFHWLKAIRVTMSQGTSSCRAKTRIAPPSKVASASPITGISPRTGSTPMRRPTPGKVIMSSSERAIASACSSFVRTVNICESYAPNEGIGRVGRTADTLARHAPRNGSLWFREAGMSPFLLSQRCARGEEAGGDWRPLGAVGGNDLSLKRHCVSWQIQNVPVVLPLAVSIVLPPAKRGADRELVDAVQLREVLRGHLRRDLPIDRYDDRSLSVGCGRNKLSEARCVTGMTIDCAAGGLVAEQREAC